MFLALYFFRTNFAITKLIKYLNLKSNIISSSKISTTNSCLVIKIPLKILNIIKYNL
jgi:hypothetical protein